MYKIVLPAITVFLLLISDHLAAQSKQTASGKTDRCGTMLWLNDMMKDYPGFKVQFEENEKKLGKEINRAIQENNINQRSNRTSSISTIPVVFHVVLSNQSLVTDAMIMAQLNRINQDYAGLNADSSNGSPFFSVRGHSKIQFCLAKRTPLNSATTGIDRVTSGTLSNSSSVDPVKSTADGGVDAWDPDKYVNIWIANFTQSDLLGYSTFPIGTAENPSGLQSQQGLVIQPGTLPGGSNAPFNLGRTMTHELGHYLYLYHIWGDDVSSPFTCPSAGGCSGTDFPGSPSLDDTPNQCAATDGCLSGIQTDVCSPSSPGYMFQNFMDYTDDACMTMFTKGQNIRAETAINTFRPGLLTSSGCLPPVFVPNNASISTIVLPIVNFRTCDPTIPLTVTLRNSGSNQLTSVVLTVKRNGTIVQTFSPPGLNLPSGLTQNIVLNTVPLVIGTNLIEICTSLPNGQADGDPLDDCKTVSGIRSATDTPLPLSEGFEGAAFPPAGWLINNQDNSFTWQKNTNGVAHSGLAKAFIDNYNYGSPDQTDDLITPPLVIGVADSLWVSFWGAYRSFPGNPSEILQVAVSTNCGVFFNTVYNARNDTSLVAPPGSSPSQSTAYIPSNINQWVNKSIDITPFINSGTVQIRFRSINKDGNNLYLDDININKKIFVNNDAGVIAISNPQSRICSNSGTPLIIIKNFGKTNLTSVKINYQVDGTGTLNTLSWTGNLARNQTATITFPVTNFGVLGNHSLNVFTSEPNNVSDQDLTNDTLVKTFQVLQIISLPSTITEEFTSSVFPPANWNIYNPDADMTWSYNPGYGNKRTGTAWFNDYNNNSIDRTDDLALPNYSYSGIDSIFTTFNLATITKTLPFITGTRLDTLSVLLSKDCGNTFTTIYKKYGEELQTVINPTDQMHQSQFFPTIDQWRRDSLNLGNWLGNSEPQFQLVFRFHGNFENNLFLDDVNIRTQILPDKLKKNGYLILPNPFQRKFNVWFYQQPTDLTFINVYNATGQLVWTKQFSGNAGKITEIDLGNKAPGMYIVTLGYKDKKNNLNIQVVKL